MTMIPSLKSVALVTLLCTVVAAPLGAQTPETPDARLARTAVEALPIGATVKLRTREGDRLKAVLLSAGESGVRVKPATRVPEASRYLAYDQIERIERYRDQ